MALGCSDRGKPFEQLLNYYQGFDQSPRIELYSSTWFEHLLLLATINVSAST